MAIETSLPFTNGTVRLLFVVLPESVCPYARGFGSFHEGTAAAIVRSSFEVFPSQTLGLLLL